MITTELVFVHGTARPSATPTALSEARAPAPGPEPGLGYAQAERAARRLATEHLKKPFDVIYTGPRIRLVQTGEIIARPSGSCARRPTRRPGPRRRRWPGPGTQ